MAPVRITSILIATAWLLALTGCGDEPAAEATGLTCGDGTVDTNGVCMPAETGGDLTCGAGTTLEGAECVATEMDPPATTCGPGTVDVDGVCELDPEAAPTPVTCGEGTSEVDGACVADVTPPPPLVVSELHVIDLHTAGPFGAAPTALKTGFPVSLWATIKGEATAPFQAQVLFGLTGATSEEGAGDQCLLGAKTLHHPGTAAEVIVGGEFIVPPGCLDDPSTPTDGQVMNPLVLIDPDNDLGLGDEQTETLHTLSVFGPGPSEAASFEVCPEGDAGCAREFLVRASDGLDFHVKSATTSSSVVILGDPDSGVTVNKAGEMVYGYPELQLDTSVVAYGSQPFDDDLDPVNLLEDNDLEFRYYIRPLGQGDAWQPLYLHTEGDPAKADPAEAGVDSYEVAVETHLIASAPMEVRHGLYVEDHCGTPCGDSKCTNNDTCTPGGYCVLDPALGTDPEAGGCDATKKARSLIMHGAWRENVDFEVRTCIETIEESEGGANMGPEAMGPESLPNCADTMIKILRADDPATQGTGMGPPMDESGSLGWSEGEDVNDTKGEGTGVELEYNLSVWGIGDMAGLRFSAEADAELSLTSFDIDIELASVWYRAKAVVTLIDSGTDWGISLLGFDVAGEVNTLDDAGEDCDEDDDCASQSCELVGSNYECEPGVVFYLAEPLEIEESWEEDWNGVAWIIPYTISFEAELVSEVSPDISLSAEDREDPDDPLFDLPGTVPDTSIWGEDDGYWDEALTVGAVWAGVTASNEASLTLQLGIGNSSYGVNGGVGGTLTLWDLQVPVGARLAWGAVNEDTDGTFDGLKLRLDVGAWAQLDLLEGTIYVYIDAQSDPCWIPWGWWGFWSLCWEQVYYNEIASFAPAASVAWTLFSVTDCSVWDGEDDCPRFEKCLGDCTPGELETCANHCGDTINVGTFNECSCGHSCLFNNDCCDDKYDYCLIPDYYSCHHDSQCQSDDCHWENLGGMLCWP